MRARILLAALTGLLLPAPSGQLQSQDSAGRLIVRAAAPDVIRLEYVPAGVASDPTEILDPTSVLRTASLGSTRGDTIATSALHASVSASSIQIQAAGANPVSLTIDRAVLATGVLRLTHAASDVLYGLRGYGLRESRDPRLARANGLTRPAGAPVAAAAQGDGGAPLAYSATWGVLVDTVDADVTNADGVLQFSRVSRRTLEAYITIGPPKRTIAVTTDLTGHPPLPPTWTLGFMNSQWGTDEREVTSIVATYREKHIPLDAFILDFDFKAWGEDDFGEFRWNSTSGAGSVAPNKYPDGDSGEFARRMAAQGVHLVGIMKPRVLVENTEHQPTKAAAEATARGWWMPGKKPYTDYFSKRLANDFDFSKPDLRAWYWQHSRHLFDTGIAGWWNDEADDGFPSLGFFHMQQALYEGQRGVSDRRVWSLNRNFYLGAQRFAFGTWSGDINTGFAVMADQRARMLATVDLAQPHWSMDTGGFNGHPSPENYARWMEFAAVVPIMRVHNTFGEHRQPWIFGDLAEAAAKKAILLRYTLFPSLYAWEREAQRTGVGIVRPLFWEFPEDPRSANRVDEWMLGDALLVAPVVEQGQTKKSIYLPPGRWFEMLSGAAHEGGQTVDIDVDAATWSDLPMFARAGSILATTNVREYDGQRAVTEIALDIWLDPQRPARFEIYDDDGETYQYERGASFSQVVTATVSPSGPTVALAKPVGTYRSTIASYRVRLRDVGGTASWNGRAVPAAAVKGALEVVVPAGQTGTLTVRR